MFARRWTRSAVLVLVGLGSILIMGARCDFANTAGLVTPAFFGTPVIGTNFVGNPLVGPAVFGTGVPFESPSVLVAPTPIVPAAQPFPIDTFPGTVFKRTGTGQSIAP